MTIKCSEIKVEEIPDLETAKSIIRILLKEIQKLEERISTLEKNSSNSSKPPSSDIVKPKSEQRQPGVRSIGGQPKHKGIKHELLPADKVDSFITLKLSECPCC